MALGKWLNEESVKTLLQQIDSTLKYNFGKVKLWIQDLLPVSSITEETKDKAVTGEAVGNYVDEKVTGFEERLEAVEQGMPGVSLSEEVTQDGENAVKSKGIYKYVDEKIKQVEAGGVVLDEDVTEHGENAVKGSGVYKFVTSQVKEVSDKVDNIADLTSAEVIELYKSIMKDDYLEG